MKSPISNLQSALLCVICGLLLTGCMGFSVASKTTKEAWTTNLDNTVTYSRLTDKSRGRGIAFFVDPKASGIYSKHVNQTNLGGGRIFSMGELSGEVSTNGIKSAGEAGGKLVGSSAKTMFSIP